MRDEHQQEIGRVIAHLRELQGWSQRQLAKTVHVDQSALSRVEAGRRRVSARELQRFADAFHVSTDSLLAGLPGGDAPAWPEEQVSDLPAAGSPVERLMMSSAGSDAVFYQRAQLIDEGSLPDDGQTKYGFTPGPLHGGPQPHPDLSAAEDGHEALSLPRGLPPEVAAVAGDWFELRRLAGGDQPALPWSTGHSAEGRPERFAHPIQPAERGSLGGDVLYDRVARFWRSELHVEPDDGPLPDPVPLLEDGLGAQVIVARVGAGAPGDEPAPAGADPAASADRPVCACFTASGTPFLFVNAARPVVLQRFALAHALAHLVLGHGDVVDAGIEWSRNNPREAAANDFAEEFLAPVRAVDRWYQRRGEPRPDVETLLELGNAFGISAWAALYRSRAARRLHARQFAQLNHQLRALEWELLPRQAFLGGLRDTLTHLTPGECLPQGQYGPPALLRVPAPMRAWAFAAVQGGRLSIERAAAFLRLDARELAAQLARLGLE